MSTTNQTYETVSTDEQHDLNDRDTRALQQYLTVLDEDPRVRGADDLYVVVSQSGSEYLVDAATDTCTCEDFEHNLPAGDRTTCKHRARVAFATGERPIPTGVDGVDPQLGDHVSGEPRTVATDGGAVVEGQDATGGYTYHVEPEPQGGLEYVRCDFCRRELLVDLGGKERLHHADGCPNATEDH